MAVACFQFSDELILIVLKDCSLLLILRRKPKMTIPCQYASCKWSVLTGRTRHDRVSAQPSLAAASSLSQCVVDNSQSQRLVVASREATVASCTVTVDMAAN